MVLRHGSYVLFGVYAGVFFFENSIGQFGGEHGF